MPERSIQISFKINFPVILIAVLLLHALVLIGRKAPAPPKITDSNLSPRRPLQIKNIRTLGAKDARSSLNPYLQKSDSSSTKITKKRFAQLPTESKSNIQQRPSSKSLSMKDLAVEQVAAPMQPSQRPGERPESLRSKGLSAISLKGQQLKEFAQAEGRNSRPMNSSAARLSGDPRAASLSNSDILVNLEVPEGVNPDELNKYELMFYSFQRRTAINYINSFYKNLDKFQQKNPHLNFPMTESKQVMTGRLTYDDKGNIRQIKMIRWSNVDRLQDFFLDVLKDMDTLHNPPQALLESSGEFSIFFSLIVNG